MRSRTLGALGVAAAAGAWSLPAAAPIVPMLADALGIPRRLATPAGIALTFDDGPHARGTPAVLDELARADAAATFFLVGEQVERFPALAAEIAAAGHEIALHGYRHRLLLWRTIPSLEDDLDRAVAVIHSATGTVPLWYRPPYGVFSLGALALLRRREWRPMLWSRWGHDWRAHTSPVAIASEATAELCAGDVVLLHDADHYGASGSWRRTAAALPAIVDAARELGEPLVSLTQAM